MKREIALLVALIFVFGATAVLADVEAVNTGFGTMTIGGIFQAGFNYYVGDELLSVDETSGALSAADRPEDMEFLLKRARLLFTGAVVDEKVKYCMQIEAASESGMGLLDAKLGFKYIPYTTIWVGRFLPNFTYWTPKHTAKLYLIDYPLMNTFFGVQRQTGLDIAFNHEYVDVNLGFFNGRNYGNLNATLDPGDRTIEGLGNQTWQDENSMKDIYFNVIAKPINGLNIWAGLWYGLPLDYMEEDKGENVAHDATAMAINGGAGYIADFGLRAWAEVLYSTLSYDSGAPPDGKTDRADDTYDLTSMSYYVRVGYNIKEVSGVPLEFLVQYDFLDPDTMNDEKKHGADDELTYVTGGVNYYIKDWHAMLYLNYIYKMEAWKDINNKEGDDTQDGIANDELKLQAQIAF